MKRTHLLAVAAIALASVVGLVACSAIPSGSAAPHPTASSRGGFGGGGFGAGGGFPGVIGTVAAVDGSTIQVQSTSSQTAVSWTSSTRFTDETAASSSALAVGNCVVARPARSGSDASGTTIAASTVEITPSQNGTCALTGFAGRSGQRPGTGQGAAAPRPSASPGARRGFGGAGAIGTDSFVVRTVARTGASASPQRDETVTWSSTTTFSRLAASTAAAVKVGVCVTAQGKTDDTGALAAATIAVSQPVNGSCASFGGFGGRGQGGSGSGSTGTGSGALYRTGTTGATIDG